MDGFYIQEKKIILDFSINNKISRKTSFQDTGKELRSCEIPWKITVDKGAGVWLGPNLSSTDISARSLGPVLVASWPLPTTGPLPFLLPHIQQPKMSPDISPMSPRGKMALGESPTLRPGILHVKDESFFQSSPQAQGVDFPSPCLSLLKCFLLSSIPLQTRRQKAWTEVSSLNTT